MPASSFVCRGRSLSYADDMQVHVSTGAADVETAVERIVSCKERIESWMSSNRLKMNGDKTQVIWIGSRQQLAKVDIKEFQLLSKRGIIWGAAGGRRPPRKKKKRRKKKKKKKKRKKKKKKKERKKGPINNVKLLHIKCCFSNFSIVRWHWKIKKILVPTEKLKWCPWQQMLQRRWHRRL